MIKRSWLLLAILLPVASFAQQTDKAAYNLSKDRVLYTIGYAHLDTEWNWDYPETINTSIRNTMTQNFHLFEKYPDYVFNFTGSRRYQMMKEYYPELYKKVIDYVHQGRWKISGSSVDEAEVNMSSSESLIRQVLYGNQYFKKEFGKVSQDYMLPDCFGFLANTPTIWHYCGLKGFSTQKLTWGSAVGIPFNVGVWNGPDGKGIIAALNATSYTSSVVPRLDKDSAFDKRLAEDQAKYGISFDYRYYGVGDQGGAPRERDVKNAVGSLPQADSKFKVALTSSDQMYKDITPEIRQKLPVYTGDLLLTQHSAGSLTSQSFIKRMNRKNELLAKSAEASAVMADWTGGAAYPREKLTNAWSLVLGSQDHDILPGTASPTAFQYAWNDEFIAANGFAEVEKHSVERMARQMDTRGQGRSVVVYNPVAMDREDVVTAEMNYTTAPADIQVYDGKGKPVPTQITDKKDNNIKFIFLAHVPSVGVAVFDVRETSAAKATSTLSASDHSLENAFYKVTVDAKGDLASVFDKKAGKELLAKPAQLEFQHEAPRDWPAWNMDWSDRQKPPIGTLNEQASIRVVEQGPVRVALEIKRQGQNSHITQYLSLSAGEAGKRVEVANTIDWQSKAVSLKAAFPLTVSDSNATYDLGAGAIQRSNNNAVKYEVPAKEWFDLTDKSGQYGVSILNDCKYGSDKPSDNEVRLTLLYTPEANRGYRYQNTQDWGVHQFKYGIYGHKGNWAAGLTPWQGAFFNEPMLAFETPAHDGVAGKSFSFLTNNNPGVGVMSVKKMEENGYYLVRVNELLGKEQKDLVLGFPANIEDAYEVDGQEQKIGAAQFSKNHLTFDLTHYTIRSYAVRLAAPARPVDPIKQQAVMLAYNQDVMSHDDNRSDGTFGRGGSIPAEMMPDTVTSEDVKFIIGSREDEANNAVVCRGQVIDLPAGDYTRLYILAATAFDAQFGNRFQQGRRQQQEPGSPDFAVDGKKYPLTIQAWSGFIGQFYTRQFALDKVTVTSIDSPYAKQADIAWFASHTHRGYQSENLAYQYAYLYKYQFNIPAGAKQITLPQNMNIRIVAMTVTDEPGDNTTPLQPLYDDFRNSPPVQLR